ncbi:nuclease-related domain-containing protein [Cytobacillus oceanisediminis]|uniref:nuclease-related domain-containing protein n=1 Tax=Cytobacillus oceanisediminis TaxID=665099 RepID=UPI0037368945
MIYCWNIAIQYSQIDSLLITGESIYIFEVKNFEGDFYIEKDRWCTTSKSEIKNPLLQLQRIESLLRRLLHDLGFNFPIKSYLIFINPEFYLYQAPFNLPAIFPAQLNRFINKLKITSTSQKDKNLRLSKKLISLGLKETPFVRKPQYTFEKLEKGITCLSCGSFLNPLNKNNLWCQGCGFKEDITHAVIRSIKEFRLLFPEKKITTSIIHEWCKIIRSKKTIRRILLNNFQLINNGKSTHYE